MIEKETVKLEDSLTAMIRITKENEEIDKKKDSLAAYNSLSIVSSFSNAIILSFFTSSIWCISNFVCCFIASIQHIEYILENIKEIIRLIPLEKIYYERINYPD